MVVRPAHPVQAARLLAGAACLNSHLYSMIWGNFRPRGRAPLQNASCPFKRKPPERWPSGLRRTLGKRVCGKPYRGFESHSLRQIIKKYFKNRIVMVKATPYPYLYPSVQDGHGRMATIMVGENSARKQRGRPFQPGQSGNPAGKPKGARNRATLAAEALLDGEATALTRKAIELALAGDSTALRLCLECLLPARKERLIEFSLPAIVGPDDVPGAVNSVLPCKILFS